MHNTIVTFSQCVIVYIPVMVSHFIQLLHHERMSAELYLVILNVLHSIMFSIFPRNSTIARGSKAYESTSILRRARTKTTQQRIFTSPFLVKHNTSKLQHLLDII